MAAIKTPTNTLDQNQVIYPQSQLITTKLTEVNFLVWKQQILAAINGYGLEGYLTGEISAPDQLTSEKTLNPAYGVWKRQDQVIASWLLSSLSESILITTVGFTTSKQIWDALTEGFASQSRAKIMQYKLQLQNLRKGTNSMREYLNRAKVCCDMLATIGYKLSEEEQIMYILTGLNAEYNAVVVSINSRVEPYTLMEVHALLLSFESRLESLENTVSQINSEGSLPSANVATNESNSKRTGYNQGGRGRNNQSFNRTRGGRFGGFFRGRGGRNTNGWRQPKCQICFIPGHSAAKCFHRANLNFVPTSNNNSFYTQNQSTDHNSNDPHANRYGSFSANVASTSQDHAQETCWFPDSGATNHLTYDLGNLNLAHDYQGTDRIQIGNGSGSEEWGNSSQRER